MSNYKWKPFTLLVSAEEVENAVGVKLEAGKYYKTRDGRKVGPMRVIDSRDSENGYFHCNEKSYQKHGMAFMPEDDLISEWHESPIREVTRSELVPGVYGRFEVTGTYQKNKVTMNFAPSSVGTSVPVVGINAEELREAAHLFTQLAEYLESEGK